MNNDEKEELNLFIIEKSIQIKDLSNELNKLKLKAPNNTKKIVGGFRKKYKKSRS
jgi:hypothetical protein